jgi:tetratricopeptide (TPR) repeat protein
MTRALSSCLLVLAFAAVASAQPKPPTPPEPPHPPRPGEPDSPERRAELRKRIAALRMARLTQELDLDEATCAKLFPVINRHDEKVSGLAEERGKTLQGMAEALHSGGADKIPAALDRLADLEHQIHEADEATHKKVREVLTPEQAAKFFLFHEHFHEEVRAMLEEAHRGEVPAPPGVPGGPGGPGAPEHRVHAILDGMGHAVHEKKYDEALDLFEQLHHLLDEEIKAPADNPASAHADELLGQVIADADHAIAQNPGDAAWWVRRARAKLLRGDAAGAIADTTHALELDPTQVWAWLVRAHARVSLGDLHGARADVQKAVELDPTNPVAIDMKKHLDKALEKK